MSKALLKSKVWRQLQVALQVQQKWREENRDWQLIDRANRRVTQLTLRLEAVNVIDDTPVICE